MVDPGWIQTRSTYSFTDLRIILKFRTFALTGRIVPGEVERFFYLSEIFGRSVKKPPPFPPRPHTKSLSGFKLKLTKGDIHK